MTKAQRAQRAREIAFAEILGHPDFRGLKPTYKKSGDVKWTLSYAVVEDGSEVVKTVVYESIDRVGDEGLKHLNGDS